MAKRRSQTRSYGAILATVLFLMFSMLAAAMLFRVFHTDTDIRSQAAIRTDVTAAIWDFPGTTPEGWSALRFGAAGVRDGMLFATVPADISRSPYFRIHDASVKLPTGNKTLRLHVRVGGPSGLAGETCAADVRRCADGSFVSRDPDNGCRFTVCRDTSTAAPVDADEHSSAGTAPVLLPPDPTSRFTFHVYYRLQSKQTWEKPLSLEGVADGVLREYTLRLPQIAEITVDDIQITVSRTPAPTTIALDWIKLVYQRTPAWNNLPSTPAPSGTPAPLLRRHPGFGNRICAQVLTPARQEGTGVCRTFATPCDIPQGWKADRSCADDPGSTPAPTAAPTLADCPANGWVNCMPGPGPVHAQCTPAFLEWAYANCPDFHGPAY